MSLIAASVAVSHSISTSRSGQRLLGKQSGPLDDGVVVERVTPGHPELNGSDERSRTFEVVVDVVAGNSPATAGEPASPSSPSPRRRRSDHPRAEGRRPIRRYRVRVKRLWTTRVIDAPASELWRLLTAAAEWPRWGPTVRSASVEGGELALGSSGTVTTIAGVDLPFEVTDYDEGARWAWKVAGIAATDHTVEPVDGRRCRVGFGVPWPAAPYLAVCSSALRRLDRLATSR